MIEKPVLMAMERLTAAADVDVDLDHLKQALAQADGRPHAHLDESWINRIESACHDIGLRPVRLARTVREAVALAQPGTPLLIRAANPVGGQARWIVLIEGRGGRVRVQDGVSPEGDQWISLATLESWLTPDGQSPDVLKNQDWLLVHASSPMQGATTQAGFEDTHEHLTDHHDGHPDHGLHPLRRMYLMLKPEMADLRVVLAFAVTVGILGLATPLTVEALVSTVAFGTYVYPVFVLAILLMAFLSMAAFLYALQAIVVEIIQRRFFVRVVADLSYRLPRVQASAFDKLDAPEQVNRFFDVMTIQKAIASIILDGIALVLNTLIGLALLAFYHPFLLGFDIALIVAIFMIIVLLGRGGIRTSIAESHRKYATAHWLEQLARNMTAFKSSGGPTLAVERADSLAKGYIDDRRDHFRILIRQIYFALGLQVVASTVLLGIGGWLVIEQQLTLGQLVAAELIVATIVGSVAKMGKLFGTYYDLMAATDKIGHLLDLPVERTDGCDYEPSHPKGASVRFHHVSYHDHCGQTRLNNVDLDLEPGMRLALLGPTGAGKGAVLDLLFGIRNPDHGTIEIDGADIRNLRLTSLRKHIGLAHGVELIHGTVLENVRMGRRDISMTEVRQALDSVRLWDDLARRHDGLHLALTPTGSPLSFGQARQIIVARALIQRPSLVLLNESLDGLDPEIRLRMLETLLDPHAPWTLIVTTHDEDVAALFPRCLMVDHGRLTEWQKVKGVHTNGISAARAAHSDPSPM